MPDLRLVPRCLKGKFTYHGQDNSDDMLTERETRRFINNLIDNGPYMFKEIRPNENKDPRPETKDDLTGDDLKQYEANIEAMNLILISIPNHICNLVDGCQTAREMWLRVERRMWGIVLNQSKKVGKTHDSLALIAHSSSSYRSLPSYYITHPSFVANYDDEYQGETFQNDLEDSLTSTMMLLARTITQCYSTLTDNQLRSSSNIRNQAVMQVDRVNIQSRYCYNCIKKGHYAHNCPNPRVQDSKYFMEQMLLAKKDEAGVIISNEQNDFLLVDIVQMEELEELSANICMMARIKPAHIDSDEGLSYDSAFISEVQTPSTSYMNLLFTNNDHEQAHLEQPKIINSTIGDDQINGDIIFDNLNVKVNNGSVDHDNHAHDSYELEQLARNAYKEAEKQHIIATKVKQQNVVLTKQLEQYKERLRVLEINTTNKMKFQTKFIEANIKVLELQNTQSVLKRKMNADEDKYLDDILNLEPKLKTNENLVIKMSQFAQALFMLGPKPLSFYDPKLKHGLGYKNPYTLKKVTAHNPKLYDASCFNSSKVHVNVCDTEEILKEASKSQIKMENKLKDPIAIKKKQNFRPTD
uniref:CCHC-type domain-containing protein n=1 Tax=Tanacetum cinerariifolium TaxID=118510 RepID=A0A6L2JPL5_TANCI|nr:hypothetical protein [Tanacetum cinerariifolium]